MKERSSLQTEDLRKIYETFYGPCSESFRNWMVAIKLALAGRDSPHPDESRLVDDQAFKRRVRSPR